MNETQKRIAEYKKALPKLKERVAAAVLLVIIAFAMATTSTFAWLVLSRAPEVSGVTTSLAANGNLEIALVGPEGKIPAESAVGDSNLDLILKNITWGNLVNLSDPRYGLDNLVLRPAQLSTATLNTQPLYGAEYTTDGRIEKLNTDFGYATWVAEKNRFEITNALGIRVISSVTRTFADEEAVRFNMQKNVKELNLAAVNDYVKIANNQECMQSLATMMGLYMTARMNPDDASLSNPDCAVKDIQNLATMYEQFLIAFEKEAEAMAALLNYQIFLIDGTTTPMYTKDQIWTLNSGNMSYNGKRLQLTDLATFQKNYNTIVADLAKLKTIAESGTSLKWKDSGLNDIVNNLVDVGRCTIGSNNTPISSIGASNASSYLSGTQEARITNGILYNFECRIGGYIEVKNLGISATVKRYGITVPATVKANVQTSASRDTNLFQQDLNYADSLYTTPVSGGTMVANDTYGLAIDLWVRTNAEGSFLTLGGNVLVETRTERAMSKDADGNEVGLYVVDITTDGETQTYDLYQKDDVWYLAVTHATFDLPEDASPREKYVDVDYVVGYEGENRVWDGSYGLSVNSTTQGSGSCYVFYADSPEDQAKSLTLLASMKIAFVDANGKKLATAIMDTEQFYAKDGKVIVPMILDAGDSVYLGEDVNGNERYAITALQKNVATRITAILYLDGTKLDNTQVLSAASIQGQLNVQFESSADLNNVDNEELRVKELKVGATLDKTSFNYDESSETNPMITNVAVTVDGSQPKTMTAFFIRKINDTQGSREETMSFTYDSASGTWKAAYEFTAPGNYLLREVRLDGIEYELTQIQTVTIAGFTLKSLDWDEAGKSATFMTANSSVSTGMTLSFASNDVNKMPKTVHGRFIRESDGSVANVQFTYDPVSTKWKGTATFGMSGEYSLQYLVLDGKYEEIPESMQKFVTAYLGMRVRIYTTSPQTFKYVPDEMAENEKNLRMQVVILDDSGNELRGLSGTKLRYARQGSMEGMDANLTWNGSTGYYEGTFNAKLAGVGIYNFAYVTVTVGETNNTITNALTSPEFRIMPPEPPSFLSAEKIEYATLTNLTYQFNQNGNASLSVVMENAGAASAKAVFQDTKGNTYEVLGTSQIVQYGDDLTNTNETIFTFTIPTGANGKQDGTWTIVELKVWNYYDDSGNLVTEDSPMIIGADKIAGQANNVETKTLSTKVVATVLLSFGENPDKNYSGAFLEKHELKGLTVTVTDLDHEAIPAEYLSQVKLTYKYNGDTLTYGGYESSSILPKDDAFQVTLIRDSSGDGKTFVQSGTVTLEYAGSWVVSKILVGHQQYTIGNLTTPKITVSSVKPSVTISAVSPSEEISTKITWKKSLGALLSYTLEDKKTSTIDTANNTVTVYAKATTGSDGEGVGTGDAGFARPTLSFTAAGIDDSTQVAFTIPKGNATSDIKVTLTGTTPGACTLGSTKEVYTSKGLFATYSVRGYFGHGDQTISTITITKDGIVYTVTLDKPIVIHNPSSVNKTS